MPAFPDSTVQVDMHSALDLATTDTVGFSPAKAAVVKLRAKKPYTEPSITEPCLVGRYRKLLFLGAGEFGRVYLVRDEVYGTSYAMKELVCNNAKAVSSVLTEILVLQRLRHRHLVEIIDTFAICMVVHVVMEHCTDGNLYNVLSSALFRETGQVIQTMRDVAQAVSYLHEKGIAHHDLKPENLLFTRKDAKRIVKVADYGLFKIWKECIGSGRGNSPRRQQRPHSYHGPQVEYTYTAPEDILYAFANGDGFQVDRLHVDVYSMGIIFQEMTDILNSRIAMDPRMIRFNRSLLAIDHNKRPSSCHVHSVLAQFCVNSYVYSPILPKTSDNDRKTSKRQRYIRRSSQATATQENYHMTKSGDSGQVTKENDHMTKSGNSSHMQVAQGSDTIMVSEENDLVSVPRTSIKNHVLVSKESTHVSVLREEAIDNGSKCHDCGPQLIEDTGTPKHGRLLKISRRRRLIMKRENLQSDETDSDSETKQGSRRSTRRTHSRTKTRTHSTLKCEQ
ncbi:uncharacterized protein [Ptychodera flava]|uniref:uncharacterized protein n=1 Tax=Ptychodera flava TaxID=63121 RepID=UPI00396A0EE4